MTHSVQFGLSPDAPRAAVACKCCGATTTLFGSVDSSRNCEERHGVVLPPTGELVSYWRCTRCGFLFTPHFDRWSRDDFAREIYNESYAQIDPEYLDYRPTNNASLIEQVVGTARAEVRVLDYGGGNGVLAERLRARGFPSVETYDPFVPAFRKRPSGRFDLVVCFEVVEHAPSPRLLFEDLLGFVAKRGMVLFSTAVQPPDIDAQGTSWWYVAPRNGHVSLHTELSLANILAARRFNYQSANPPLHVAYREMPAFAAHLWDATAPTR